MGVYFVNILALMGLGAYFYHNKNLKDSKMWFCIIIFVQLTIISGFRESIGFDYNSYRYHFYEISKLSFFDTLKYNFEPGFSFLNKVILYFTDNYKILIFICSFITTGFVSYSIYKNSKYPFYSFFLYITLAFYYASFNLIRQGLAISISILGLKYLKERKFLKYLLIILIAASFHYSALVMIPVYFFVNINLTYKKIIIFFLITSFGYIFFDKILAIALKIFPMYSEYLYSDFLKPLSVKSILIFLFIFIILLFFKKYIIDQDKKNSMYINIAFLCFLISIFQTKIGVLDRIPYYLNIFSIFSIPLIIDCFENEKQKRLAGTFIIIFGILYNVYIFLSRFHGVTPYSSIFN